MEKIKIECPSCSGSGLYSGFCEAKGEAVICLGCDGQGWCWYSYKKFNGRVRKRGIKSIRHSRGTFILTGVGGTGESMTYQEFEKRFPAKD